ncbi:hypothetical protein BEWA_032420 [Theileria equi strain WA]|uniref:Uncharacterized protein n=1 Tax=Theileria equi strain WA TaxID=1537102 RepID=L0AZU8_THEEQ|nr:hypothetical protein BEWA_032420 [Theileria equi strain WA]AFZ80389.1 hypothetical protein BEWA_032420 [Theileria equi strain WA]|eukprot:XP_004830055.1 hypothetical protein BEWA_032420 [Theileria equi strain WA]
MLGKVLSFDGDADWVISFVPGSDAQCNAVHGDHTLLVKLSFLRSLLKECTLKLSVGILKTRMSAGVLTLNVEGKCGENGNKKCNCDNSGKFVAEKNIDTPVKGFIRVTHQHKSGDKFTLSGYLQNGGKIGTRGQSIPGVKEVSVFYWDGVPTNPVLLEVTFTTTPFYYARSSGSNWNFIFQSLSDELLETYLDQQNCQHHNAVTLDLSYKDFTGQHRYCCSGNHSDGARVSNRVTVTSMRVSCKEHHQTTSYYKHEVNTSSGTGIKLAAIKYNSVGKRKRIEIPGLALPTKQSVKLYVFYCGNTPKLIYVEGESPPINKWFKPNGSDERPWTQISLQDIAPDDFKDCSHGKYDQLMTELQNAGCGVSKCPPPRPVPSPQPISGQHSGGSSGGGPSSKTYKDSNINIPAIIVTSILVGTGGITGFAYLLYNNSRDPWVRQI